MSNLVNVNIVDVNDHYSLIQHEPNGLVDRLYIPRVLFPNSLRKVPAQLPEWVLAYGVPYTDVNLEGVLGDYYADIRTVEQSMRRHGLWLREDYRKSPQKVRGVLLNLGRIDIDVATIVNAAFQAEA